MIHRETDFRYVVDMRRAKVVGFVAATLLVVFGASRAFQRLRTLGVQLAPSVQIRYLDTQGKEVETENRFTAAATSPADLSLEISLRDLGDRLRALLFLFDDRGQPIADCVALTAMGRHQSVVVSLRPLWPLSPVARGVLLIAPGEALEGIAQPSKGAPDLERVLELAKRANAQLLQIQIRIPGATTHYEPSVLENAEQQLAHGEFSGALALVDSLGATIPARDKARAAVVAAEAAWGYGRTALSRAIARNALLSAHPPPALRARLQRVEILAIAEGSESSEPPPEREVLRQSALERPEPLERAQDAALDLRLAMLHDRFSGEPPRARACAQELLRLARAVTPEQQLVRLAPVLCLAVRMASSSDESYDASLLQSVSTLARASGDPAAVAGCSIATGDLFKWRSQWANAQNALDEALQALSGKDLPREQREAWYSAGALAAQREDFRTAFAHAKHAARWVERLLALETNRAAREQLLINTVSYYGAAERFGALASPHDATAAVAVAEAGKGSALSTLLSGASRADDELQLAVARRGSPSDEAFATETASIAALARTLGSGDAALSYTLLGTNAARRFELAIGVVTREKVTVTLVEQPDAFLTDVVGLAQAVEQNREQEAKVIGMRLYGTLIAPIAERLAGKDRLFVSPHLRLHTLPWNALHDGTQFLVHRFAFSRSLPLLLWDGAPRDQTPLFARDARARWLLALNPRHAQHESLPGLEALGSELRRALPGARVLGPRDATADRLTLEIRQSDVLLFAGHATYDAADPLSSALFTTTDHTPPLSPFWPSDRLEARTLLTLEKRLDLAILIGCETARLWRGTSSYGDEAVGLARAFLLTGARQVIGALWPVLDRDAEDFLRAFAAIEGDRDVVRHVQRANRCLAEQRCANRGIAAWASFSIESR